MMRVMRNAETYAISGWVMCRIPKDSPYHIWGGYRWLSGGGTGSQRGGMGITSHKNRVVLNGHPFGLKGHPFWLLGHPFGLFGNPLTFFD